MALKIQSAFDVKAQQQADKVTLVTDAIDAARTALRQAEIKLSTLVGEATDPEQQQSIVVAQATLTDAKAALDDVLTRLTELTNI